MTQIAKLTYEQKYNRLAIVERKSQATAEDFNEIKTIVNQCVDGINWIKCDEIALESGINHVSFLAPYPAGIPYAIIIHNCYNSKGYIVAHKISNKSVSGFDVTVSEACVFNYLSTPKR